MPAATKGHIQIMNRAVTLAAWDFRAGSLPAGFTLTRASTGFYTDNTGVMQSAAIDAARFDYDPLTNELRGLLYEKATTNLLLRSREYNNASWAKAGGATTGSNTGADIFGTTTSDPIFGPGYLNQSATVVAGTHTVYLYGKTTNNTWILLKASSTGAISSGNGFRAWFNVVTGEIGTYDQIGSGWTYVSHDIEDQGNGWFRLALTVTNVGTTINVGCAPVTGDGALTNTNTGMECLFGHSQLETGGASSPVLTSAATASRSADVGNMTIPVGATRLLCTFDDDSMQEVAVVAGAYVLPTGLNRSRIRLLRAKA